MKIVLFVPGFREHIRSRDYSVLLSAIESQGYKVKFIDINWNRTTLTEWVKQLQSEYEKYDSKQVTLAGFSFGALTALVMASSRPPSELWLFSLSPYFDDDPTLRNPSQQTLSMIGKRRLTAFRNFDFNKVKSVPSKTLIFLGTYEAKKWPFMLKRAKLVNASIRDSRLVLINNVGHEVEHAKYVSAIKNEITGK